MFYFNAKAVNVINATDVNLHYTHILSDFDALDVCLLCFFVIASTLSIYLCFAGICNVLFSLHLPFCEAEEPIRT